MRILLDECVPWTMRRLLSQHSVTSVQAQGWSGIRNSELLRRAEADFDGPTFDYKAKGNKVEFAGKEDVQGSPAYKLHVTTKDGKELNVYLDAETYLAIKVDAARNVQGQDLETETTIGDYKTVDGLVFP